MGAVFAQAKNVTKQNVLETLRWQGAPLRVLLKRPEEDGERFVTEFAELRPYHAEADVWARALVEVKYEGYIQRQLQEIDKFRHLEQIKLPEGLDFDTVHGLSSELKEKLAAVRPASLGQASRIEGMTPAAISVLMVHLRLWKSR